MINTGAIILAAGSSRRLGGIKQLLHFNGKTLLQHTIDEAIKAGAQPVMVVTGAHAKEVSASVDNRDVEIVFNENWEQGIASGIAAGVRSMIAAHKNIENIIIAVCDQPFVTAALFGQLFETQKNSSGHIVASAYADTIGIPVLFTRKYFDHLLDLKGDEGAKKILMTCRRDVATVDFPLGHIDIDTPDNYENLLKRIS